MPLSSCIHRSAATTHPPDKRRPSSAAIPAPAAVSGRFPSFPGRWSPAPSSASAFQGRASGAQRELLLLSHERSRTLSRPGCVPALCDPGWNFTAKALPSQDRLRSPGSSAQPHGAGGAEHRDARSAPGPAAGWCSPRAELPFQNIPGDSAKPPEQLWTHLLSADSALRYGAQPRWDRLG